MSTPAILANVLIEGNTIDYGVATDGTSQFNYNYLNCLLTTADCKISNNHFSGINSDASAAHMISLVNCSCDITGNYFVRGSSNLAFYITGSGSNDHIITNNFFDSTTTDGLNDLFTSGLTSATIFTQNKNQTGYTSVDLNLLGLLSYETHSIFDDNGGGFINSTTLDLGIYNSSFQLVGEVQLESFIPQGATLKHITMGTLLVSAASAVSSTNSTLQFHIQPLKPTHFTVGSPSGSNADLLATSYTDGLTRLNSNTLTLNSSNAPTYLTGTKYMDLDLTAQNIKIGANPFLLGVNFTLYAATSQFLELAISSALVKYVW